jgi:hypothetical protein
VGESVRSIFPNPLNFLIPGNQTHDCN